MQLNNHRLIIIPSVLQRFRSSLFFQYFHVNIPWFYSLMQIWKNRFFLRPSLSLYQNSTMKASLSPCTSSSATNAQLFMMISMLLLVFVNSSATRLSGYPPSTGLPDASPTPSSHQLPHRELQQLHPCDALTHENSRSLCIHLYRVYQHHLPVHVPPMLTHNEIDARYGVEKRLVPSGPNPLHNWTREK